MGTRGPLSSGNAQRRNKPAAKTKIGGKADAPTLPNEERYSEDTLLWYAAWCESSQATQFGPLDWQRLRFLAPLVELYFASPTAALLAEIRQNETRLGATAADRARLGWEDERPPEEPTGTAAKPSRARPDPRKPK